MTVLHATDEALAAFAEGRLGRWERARLIEHVDCCPICPEILAETVRAPKEIGEAFQRSFAGLRAEDRLLLKLRFESGLTVPQIAKSLRKRPKALYRRFDRLIRRLRQELAAAGLKPEGAAQWDAVILWVELWPQPANEGGETVARPSPSMEDEKA